MKPVSLIAIALIVLTACNNNNKTGETTGSPKTPAAPASSEAIHNFITSHTYITERMAAISGFAMDSADPYAWYADTAGLSSFEKEYLIQQKAFQLQFTSDSTATIYDEGKSRASTYKIDSSIHEGEKAGWKLRFSYPDSSMSFPGSTGIMIMTATYPVLGIDQQRLFLETPRSFNQRKVAVLMKQQ
ncbi:MAG TPA: hypothetical protein VHM26_14600 [Chitinophagaceae bacterium]|jgi:hypothetical protein|nr:hypothetical protein [Chitinophagaceae bacterium]